MTSTMIRAPEELSTAPHELPPMPPTSLSSPGPTTPPASSPTSVLQGSARGDALLVSDPQTPTSASKKRKKRKKKTTPAVVLGDDDDAVLREAEAKISGDDEAAWRARAHVRLDRLRAVVKDADQIRQELAEATDRFADAERAEQLVNTGLRSAHMLLSEREKSLASAKLEASNLTVEVSTLTDEKKKIEKRVALLKTVSERLQEMRAACEATERRLDDSTSQNAELRSSVEEFRKDCETQRAELAKMKTEIVGLLATHEQVLGERQQADVAAVHRIRFLGAASAGVGLVAGITLRAIFGRPADRNDSTSD